MRRVVPTEFTFHTRPYPTTLMVRLDGPRSRAAGSIRTRQCTSSWLSHIRSGAIEHLGTFVRGIPSLLSLACTLCGEWSCPALPCCAPVRLTHQSRNPPCRCSRCPRRAWPACKDSEAHAGPFRIFSSRDNLSSSRIATSPFCRGLCSVGVRKQPDAPSAPVY